MALLPYNPLWLAKARGLGRTPDYRRQTWMSAEERAAVKEVFRIQGLEIVRDIGAPRLSVCRSYDSSVSGNPGPSPGGQG